MLSLSLLLLTTTLLPFTTGLLSTCYYPTGATEPNNHPCNASATVSNCCGQGQRCWSNGMCEVPSQDGLVDFVRASCTDATWQSPECLHACLDSALWEPIRPCHGPLATTYCCDPSGAGYACCATPSALFSLPAATPGAIIGANADYAPNGSLLIAPAPLFPPDSVGFGQGQVLPSGLGAVATTTSANGPATTTGTAVASGSGSGTAAPSAAGSGSGSPPIAVIGAAAGGVTALLILVLGSVLAFRRRRRRRAREREAAAVAVRQAMQISAPREERRVAELERVEKAVEAGRGRVAVAEIMGRGREGERVEMGGRGVVREMEGWRWEEKGRMGGVSVVELEAGGGWL